MTSFLLFRTMPVPPAPVLAPLDDGLLEEEVSGGRISGSVAFAPVPVLLDRYNAVFLHPTVPDWPPDHVLAVRQMMRVMQLTLEEVVAAAVQTAEFVSRRRVVPQFGISVPSSTFSSLVLEVLKHPSFPFWSAHQVQVVEEGAKLLLMIIEHTIQEAHDAALLRVCMGTPHKRHRDE